MLAQNDVRELLRRRLIGDLHLGRLKPGDRAPSLRAVARDLGVGVRAVSRAYSQLQGEGLVTIRHRSGIYMSELSTTNPPLDEAQSWYSAILTDAWRRGIRLPELPYLFGRYVARQSRCVCIESTEDHLVAFCAELNEDFGLDTNEVMIRGTDGSTEHDAEQIYNALREADFAVTTAFHMAEVKSVAEMLSKPVVVISVNEAVIAQLRERLRRGPVTMVAVDPRFSERFELYLMEALDAQGSVNLISLETFLREPARAAGQEVLVTRAARKRANEAEYHLFPPPISFLSLDAARHVTQCMIATQALQPA